MFKSPNSADAANNNNHNMETENETETKTRFRLKLKNESNSRQLLAITAGFIIIPLLKCRSTIQKRILDTLMTLICRTSHSINQAKRLLLRIIPLKISETLFSLWILYCTLVFMAPTSPSLKLIGTVSLFIRAYADLCCCRFCLCSCRCCCCFSPFSFHEIF